MISRDNELLSIENKYDSEVSTEKSKSWFPRKAFKYSPKYRELMNKKETEMLEIVRARRFNEAKVYALMSASACTNNANWMYKLFKGLIFCFDFLF